MDATAGLGGDSLVLAQAGLGVVSCDRDPETAHRLRMNLLVAGLPPRVLVARAEAAAVRTGILVLDPDRRTDSGKREPDPQRARRQKLQPRQRVEVRLQQMARAHESEVKQLKKEIRAMQTEDAKEPKADDGKGRRRAAS